MIPMTDEIELEGIENSDGILRLKDNLMNSIDVSNKGDGFTISSNNIENYHGEDCEVEYKNVFKCDGNERIYSVDKFFNPVTTSENGIHYNITTKKVNGQISSIEEVKEGYLEDKDNYYFKSEKNGENGLTHVVTGKCKNDEDLYEIAYDDKNQGIHAYNDSIAKRLHESGLSSESTAGKRMITKVSAEIKKKIALSQDSELLK